MSVRAHAVRPYQRSLTIEKASSATATWSRWVAISIWIPIAIPIPIVIILTPFLIR